LAVAAGAVNATTAGNRPSTDFSNSQTQVAFAIGTELVCSDESCELTKDGMTRISVKFTARELELLTSLASDQLFRREFIDPRLPGHRADPTDLSLGKKLVERMRATAERDKKIPISKRTGVSL